VSAPYLKIDQVRVHKIGNSLGIVIPRFLVNHLSFEHKDEVYWIYGDDILVAVLSQHADIDYIKEDLAKELEKYEDKVAWKYADSDLKIKKSPVGGWYI